MSDTIEIVEAKDRIDELLARARSGEEILLADHGNPVVLISPAGERTGKRIFGEFAGLIHMSDDFTKPSTCDELADSQGTFFGKGQDWNGMVPREWIHCVSRKLRTLRTSGKRLWMHGVKPMRQAL